MGSSSGCRPLCLGGGGSSTRGRGFAAPTLSLALIHERRGRGVLGSSLPASNLRAAAKITHLGDTLGRIRRHHTYGVKKGRERNVHTRARLPPYFFRQRRSNKPSPRYVGRDACRWHHIPQTGPEVDGCGCCCGILGPGGL